MTDIHQSNTDIFLGIDLDKSTIDQALSGIDLLEAGSDIRVASQFLLKIVENLVELRLESSRSIGFIDDVLNIGDDLGSIIINDLRILAVDGFDDLRCSKRSREQSAGNQKNRKSEASNSERNLLRGFLLKSDIGIFSFLFDQ